MAIKYEITHQFTGVPHSVDTFEEAKQLQKQFLDEYMDYIKGCFDISAMIENEDGSITQVKVDELGNPMLPDWMKDLHQ